MVTWRGRIAAPVAAVLALAWIAGAGALRTTGRAETLLPPLLLLAAAIAARRGAGVLWLPFAALAAAWLGWGAIALWTAGTGGVGACVHAALHERVWLIAAALAAVARLHGGTKAAKKPAPALRPGG